MMTMEKAIELAETHNLDFDACVEAILASAGDAVKALQSLKKC
jgi:hypothetical protein